ncbi:MAG: Peptide chain release factor 2 [Alphaproteobacteria bacterium ADurb.Bin438]|nr:MAG: Peptide chain release factor 2 [Alphaproteobacteria bacterium ADurb.Bin438]
MLNQSKAQFLLYGGVFDFDNAVDKLSELESLVHDPNLWNDAERAKKIMSEKSYLEDSIGFIKKLERDLEDIIEFIKLGEEEDDEATVTEAAKELKSIKEGIKEKELEALLNGEADKNDCFIEIHPGAGGTESCDWAEMLYRMYVKWAERRKYETESIEEQSGDEAGIKSATIKIKGINAYGWLKGESGVHRLVRISPFDSNGRRHTSFASIWVYPVIDDRINIEINEKDCRIDTYRASGAGGQHINKTDSAVRITHIPTGIVVQSQNQRSQFKNKDEAWAMLKSKLYELELKKREEKANEVEASKSDINFGHQIRSYVLYPYQLVKDLRTEESTSDADGVLDGKIDAFLSAFLLNKV